MSCQDNNVTCGNNTRCGNGFVFIIVLYILLAIILGCTTNNNRYF